MGAKNLGTPHDSKHRARHKWAVSAALFMCHLFFSSAFASQKKVFIRIPPPESDKDTRWHFPVDLLEKILRATEEEFGPAEIQTVNSPMNTPRKVQALADQELDVIWTTTSLEKEQKTLPIRIPIDKGLFGWRLFLIRADTQKEWSKIKSLSDLQKMRLGQGTGWADVDILSKAGLKVITAPYANLFGLVQAGRVDGFPRGATEIHEEWQEQVKEHPDIQIEKSLVLQYPFAQYFFTNRKVGGELARRIESGLSQLIKTKQFNAFWFSHPVIKKTLGQLSFQNRTFLKISNPLLPPETPLEDKPLWLTPQEAIHWQGK